MDEVKCPLCESDAKTGSELNFGDITIECESGDRFACSEKSNVTKSIELLSPEEKFAIRDWIARHKASKGARPPYLAIYPNESQKPNAFTPQNALNAVPPTVADRLDTFLIDIAMRSPKPGATVDLRASDAPSLFCEDEQVMRFIIEQLERKCWLTDLVRAGRLATNHGVIVLQLTADGWNRVADIERGKGEFDRRRVFIAMSFRYREREKLEDALRLGIKSAGYDPCTVDQDEYIGRFDDRIFMEIRRAAFVVADFTEHRPNVYFEAGFAEGLGKPVYYTCCKDEIDNCHSDKRQENMIVWSDTDDLANRLHKRIEAVQGRAPLAAK